MVDISAIAGTASSLKAAGEIVQAMIGLRDASAFQTKAIELQRQILTAQQSALAAHSDQFALLQRVRELEEEVRRVKAWETEKERYSLAEVSTGSFAYLVKPEARGAEPVHAICTNCYEHGRKSILQWVQGSYSAEFRCPGCKAEFPADWQSPNFPFKIL